MDVTDLIPFSTALRERSRNAHSGSEHAGFMSDLMRGKIEKFSIDTLVNMVAATGRHVQVEVAEELEAA